MENKRLYLFYQCEECDGISHVVKAKTLLRAEAILAMYIAEYEDISEEEAELQIKENYKVQEVDFDEIITAKFKDNL